MQHNTPYSSINNASAVNISSVHDNSAIQFSDPQVVSTDTLFNNTDISFYNNQNIIF